MRVVLIRTVVFVMALAFFWHLRAAQQPHIEKIELFGSNFVLLHFETQANRTYELQYSLGLNRTNRPGTTVWTNLFVVPPFPMQNHYVIQDTRTNAARFYRLRATP